MYGDENCLEREEALKLWTLGSAYKSNEETAKGTLSPGMYADLAVISADFMSVPDEEIRDITSVMTMVSGKIVYGDGSFKNYDAPIPPASPDWSPVRTFGGYQKPGTHYASVGGTCSSPSCVQHHSHGQDGKLSTWLGLDHNDKRPSFDNPWAVGCGCFAY